MARPEQQELNELHAAAERFRRAAPLPAAPPSPVRFLFPLAGAVLVGAVAAWLIPARHIVEISIEVPLSHQDAARVRLESALAGERNGGDARTAVESTAEWNLTSAPSGLRLRVWARDPQEGRRWVDALIAEARRPRQAEPVAPPAELTAARDLLHGQLEELRRRVADAASAPGAAANTDSPWSPSERGGHEAAVSAALQEIRRLRESCDRLEATRAELEAADPARTAAVLDGDREAAYAKDDLLRQDRQQLAAELTGVSRSMLEVRRLCTPLAEETLAAAKSLHEEARRRAALPELLTLQEPLDAVVRKTSQLVDLGEASLPEWDRLHAALSAAEPTRMMDIIQQIEERGRDFFFEAFQKLDEVAGDLGALRELVGLTTAAQTALSELSKGCGLARQALSRFESKAIKQRPVRLQASFEAAVRLTDRVRERTAVVDRSVFEKAIESARKQRSESLTQVEKDLASAQRALRERGAELEPLIGAWTAQWGREVESASRQADAKAQEGRLAQLEDEERRMEALLAALTRPSMQPAEAMAGAVVSAAVVRADPHIQRTRIQVGGTAAALSLCAGLLVQGATRRGARRAGRPQAD